LIPELGHFALILALLVSLAQGILPLIGSHRGNAAWIALARPAALATWLLVGWAFASLTYAFIVNDFSVVYVTQQSNTHCRCSTASLRCGADMKGRCCCGC